MTNTRRRWRRSLLGLLAVPPLLLTGVVPAAAAGTAAAPAAAPAAGVQASAAALRPPCGGVIPFDRRDFSRSTRITNQYQPLLPGTQFVMQGTADRGGGQLPHTIRTTVTDLTKRMNGIRVVVVLDEDVNEGVLSEAELAFFAQDDAGNVWSVGEYPEEFRNGRFVGAPSTWIAGVGSARAGIIMKGDPQPGTPRYLQGWAPDVGFHDCARVLSTTRKACAPVGCFDSVLLTDENNPFEPEEGHQRKFYAPGVGNIKITAVNDPEGETLRLRSVERLCGADLREVRERALRLDRRAYRYQSEAYGDTSPAQRTLRSVGCRSVS